MLAPTFPIKGEGRGGLKKEEGIAIRSLGERLTHGRFYNGKVYTGMGTVELTGLSASF